LSLVIFGKSTKITRSVFPNGSVFDSLLMQTIA